MVSNALRLRNVKLKKKETPSQQQADIRKEEKTMTKTMKMSITEKSVQ